MDPRVFPLAEIYRLNTWLFHNCLAGFSDEQGQLRPSEATNNAAFIAAHVADTRFTIAAWLGAELENPLAAALKEAKGIADVATLPSLTETRAAWDSASTTIAARLEALTAAELDGPSPARFPAGGATLLGARVPRPARQLSRRPAGAPQEVRRARGDEVRATEARHRPADRLGPSAAFFR